MVNFPTSPGVRVIYDGVDLTQWITFSDIQRTVGQSRTLTMAKVGRSEGKQFQYVSADENSIKVAGDVNYDLQSKRRQLAGVLTKSEPKMLTFSDEPSLYYMAIIGEQPSFQEDQFHGEISITFIVPDGVAHSLTTKTADNIATDGTLDDELVVQNDGTYPVYPVIEATMHSDNGVLTLINESNGGVIQLGNKSEIDGYSSKRPERALNDGFDSDPGGVSNEVGTNYPNYNGVTGQDNKQVGTMAFTKDVLGGSAMIPVFANAGVSYWGGPSRLFPIPENSAGENTGNFFLLGRIIFNTDAKSMGRFELSLANETQVVMEVVIRDSMIAGDQLVMECWVKDKLVDSRSLNRNTFKNGQYYQVEMYRFSSRLGFEISPVSEVVEGNVARLRTTVQIPFDIANHDPITGAGVWFERWKQSQHSIMSISDLQFSWTDVEYWTDTENLYADGDLLTIDMQNRQVLLNGVLKNDLDRYGNDWDQFKLSPGTNRLSLNYSDFATAPTVTAKIREAFM